MRAVELTGDMEMLILKRAHIANNYKSLTVGEASKVLLKVQSQRTTRVIEEECKRLGI